MKHFLTNQEGERRPRNGAADRLTISLDFHAGENRYRQIEPVDNLTPERLYEKRWALTLLDLVLGRLREEYCADGKWERFDVLKRFSPERTPRSTYLRWPRSWA